MPLAVSQGPENAPPGCEQIPAAISQPWQRHFNFMPTCLARSDCAATGMIQSGPLQTTRKTAAARMRWILVMALSQCGGWLRASASGRGARGLRNGGEYQSFAAIGQQSQQCAENHEHATQPNPFHKRIQECVDYGK